jgi:hypothetical protein
VRVKNNEINRSCWISKDIFLFFIQNNQYLWLS